MSHWRRVRENGSACQNVIRQGHVYRATGEKTLAPRVLSEAEPPRVIVGRFVLKFR